MVRKKKKTAYSYAESLDMLVKLQQMAIDEGNINLALKAEELKCKIASSLANVDGKKNDEDLTKILVDFINDEQHSSKDTENLCSVIDGEEKI